MFEDTTWKKETSKIQCVLLGLHFRSVSEDMPPWGQGFQLRPRSLEVGGLSTLSCFVFVFEQRLAHTRSCSRVWWLGSGRKSVATEESEVNWVISQIHDPDLICIIVMLRGTCTVPWRLCKSYGEKPRVLSFSLDGLYCTQSATQHVASWKRAWMLEPERLGLGPNSNIINSWLWASSCLKASSAIQG